MNLKKITVLPINILQVIFIAIIIFLVGFAIGVLISSKFNRKLSIENFILVISGVFIIGAVVFQVVGLLETFSSIVTTVFSSIVFSWLLTRISSKDEWEKREQELALRSYRHIDYIESASKTANKAIEQYINSDNKFKISDEEKLVLSKAMDYIGYIQGGISTCKMDWYDLMSEEGKKRFSPKTSTDQSIKIDNIEINQEDV